LLLLFFSKAWLRVSSGLDRAFDPVTCHLWWLSPQERSGLIFFSSSVFRPSPSLGRSPYAFQRAVSTRCDCNPPSSGFFLSLVRFGGQREIPTGQDALLPTFFSLNLPPHIRDRQFFSFLDSVLVGFLKPCGSVNPPFLLMPPYRRQVRFHGPLVPRPSYGESLSPWASAANQPPLGS